MQGIDWDEYERKFNQRLDEQEKYARFQSYSEDEFERGGNGDRHRNASNKRNQAGSGRKGSEGRREFDRRKGSEGRGSFDNRRSFGERRTSKAGGKSGNRGCKQGASVQKTTAAGEIICPLYRKCGGCQLQGTDYSKQLSIKQKNVSDLLGKYGKVEKIVGMKDPYHYRNKVHAVFDRDRRGNYISGIYQEGTHEVIHVEECFIENKKADEIIGSIRSLLKSFKIKTFDEDTGYGLLRHVLIRTGYHSGEIMVVLVLSSPILPSKNNFVKALLKLHPEITTIVLNVNDRRTSMILGDKQTVLYGKGYIEDTLCGCKFRISPKSFYQVNPVQTELLYNKAIEYAGLNGNQKVIDAYCGIGTIGLIASKYAKEVIGVELNSDAVKDARENSKLNQITNVSFYNNDAGKLMVEMAEQKASADVVFMDPPRSGSTEEFMDSVVKLNPSKVVYVSCNPETLARDLAYITKKGYRVKHITPFDMFPFTGHVETVVLLSR